MRSVAPIFLVGNPNVGKSTLFNALTGLNARVANYPGITVEAKIGRIKRFSGDELTLVDLPGTYSLIPASQDEELTVRALMGAVAELRESRLTVVVISANELRRGLYLYSQIIELGVSAIVAVTMVDQLSKAQIRNIVGTLQRSLGAHVVAVSVDDKASLQNLKNTLDGIVAGSLQPKIKEQPLLFAGLNEELQDKLSEDCAVAQNLPRHAVKSPALVINHNIFLYLLNKRGLLEKNLGSLDCLKLTQSDVSQIDSLVAKLPQERFVRVDNWLTGLRVERGRLRMLSDWADRFLLHPFFGSLFGIFLFASLLQGLFLLAQPVADYFSDAISKLGTWASNYLPAESLTRSLIKDGIFEGLGSVLSFLPLIAILFFFISLLEDSGYLARACVLLDRILRQTGLCGRSLMPMLSGFACAVPAIMATRGIGGKKERLITIMVTPFLTCSARLPVFGLIVGALFSSYPPIFGFFDTGAFLFMSMYALGLLASLVAAWTLSKVLGETATPRLNIELPPFRLPRPWPILKRVMERIHVFVTDVGTIILASTIFIWAMFKLEVSPIHHPVNERPIVPLEATYAGVVGKAIEPLMKPMGLDWQVGVGILASFLAREVFVSTMAVVYGLDNANEEDENLKAAVKNHISPLSGLCLLIFFTLSMQCVSTLAATRRETGSLLWPSLQFSFMTLTAYILATATYFAGSLLGFA
jgi:ferrous iron transport protein B